MAVGCHSGRASTLYKSKKLARNCHNNLKKKRKERVVKEKRVRWRGQSVANMASYAICSEFDFGDS
jgi:hypothetical protein